MEKLKAILVIALIRFLGRMSLKRIQKLGSALGTLIWRLNLSPAQVTRKNLKLCYPELTEENREEWVLASLQETGKVALEMGAVWEWPVEKSLGLIKEIRGQYLIDRAIEKRQGIIVLAPHLGNWELTGLYLSSLFRMASLYRPPKMAYLDQYMSRVRGRVGSELVPTNQRGIFRLFKILKQNGVVGILPDQEPSYDAGVFAPFFGVLACSMKLVSKMAGKTNAIVLCAWSERLPDSQGFIFHFTEADNAIYSTHLEASVAALNRSVENCVRSIPLQYQWEYKRFCERPKNQKFPHFYDD